VKLTVTISRILLGLVFTLAGASGFFLIGHPPPAPPGLAGQFQDIFFRSYWVLFVDGVEVIAGVLLLLNRYVALALALLAPVIANIIVFHLTMAPIGLPVAAIVTALWVVIALRYRASFAPLFEQQPASEPATFAPDAAPIDRA
jgi:putative oxidoreductase